MPRFTKKEIRNTAERAVILTMLALFAVLLVISITNDMYAFVKPQGDVLLSVTAPTSLDELSADLQDKGVIKNPSVFCLFAKAKKKDGIMEGFVGEAKLSRDMSYREIILAFS